MTSSPADCWSVIASSTARSSVRLNSTAVIRPASNACRASTSAVGRSRLPTTSLRIATSCKVPHRFTPTARRQGVVDRHAVGRRLWKVSANENVGGAWTLHYRMKVRKVRMNPTRFVIAAGAAGSLVAGRAVLAYVLTQVVGLALKKIPGLRGRVDGVDLQVLERRIVLHGLTIERASHDDTRITAEVDRLTVRLDGRQLLAGHLVANVTLDTPHVFVD